MRVLVFGDSITQGYWAVEHGWVDLLRMLFDKKQLKDLVNNDEPTVFNLGISADTSVDVLARIKAEVLARTRKHHSFKPAIIIQIGTNDSSVDHGKKKVGLDDYRNNLQEIIDVVRPLSSRIIFVGLFACNDDQTNPVFWGDYLYQNSEIKKYEEVMAELAKENGLNFIPVFQRFKIASEKNPSILPDGLHPNDEGHKIMFETIHEELVECLK